MFLISPPEKEFIRHHLTDDVRQLVLRPHPASIDIKQVAAQIAARQKAREKLPTWYASDDVVFPPALSVEQASSEQTAHYKASLVGGKQLLDLTGGMGIDTWGFAQRVDQVIYVEHRPELAELAAYNLSQLGATNVMVQVGDGLAIVDQLSQPADWIYLDPHRRDEQGGKVVRLADCEPDVSRVDVLASLLHQADKVLLKTSPLVDLDGTIRQFAAGSKISGQNAVESIHVVAVQGEVKEVLFVLTKHETAIDTIEINAINLLTDSTIRFAFKREEERQTHVALGNPQHYIYEPNAAVLKAGAFRLAATRFGLVKLAPNSHLYTSSDYKGDFPGRIFQLDHVIKPNQTELHQLVPSGKANLTVRNFPQSVAELRKKLKLSEGGDTYIFATTLMNGDKRLLITKKINQVASL
ncbi:MAG: hypothetical protein JWP57_2246 [Spirosoma sp.]|nr:hypothetical protein [Spirosoma sp.]